jgi:hypothetical protein
VVGVSRSWAHAKQQGHLAMILEYAKQLVFRIWQCQFRHFVPSEVLRGFGFRVGRNAWTADYFAPKQYRYVFNLIATGIRVSIVDPAKDA